MPNGQSVEMTRHLAVEIVVCFTGMHPSFSLNGYSMMESSNVQTLSLKSVISCEKDLNETSIRKNRINRFIISLIVLSVWFELSYELKLQLFSLGLILWIYH